MAKRNKINLSDKSKAKLGQLLQQRQAMDSTIQSYIQGIIDSLGLEGDWNLDLKTLTLNRVEKPKEE